MLQNNAEGFGNGIWEEQQSTAVPYFQDCGQPLGDGSGEENSNVWFDVSAVLQMGSAESGNCCARLTLLGPHVNGDV